MRPEAENGWSVTTAQTTLPLSERLRLAAEHVENHGQRGDMLWPYQRFAITLGELMDAAMRSNV